MVARTAAGVTPRKTHRPRALAGLLFAASAVLGLGGSAAYAVPVLEPATESQRANGPLIDIQLLGINDFHGRLEAEPAQNIAGAAVLAGAVNELRTQNPNAVFVSAGDNVGGTPFTSFIAQDEPTIRALTAAGLDVSAVGNHEFDRGYADLVDRIIPSYGSPALALGANVRFKDTGAQALNEYTILERSGVRIGIIGVVTEDTATSVTPELVDSLEFADQLQTANNVADRIRDDVDVTVLLTHDGSFSTDCASIAAETSSFGNLVRGAKGRFDAVFSGHTHGTYACDIDGLPVVSTGFYGGALGQVTLEVDPVTRDVQTTSAALIPLVENGAAVFAPDPAVEQIVADAVAAAETQGAQPVGRISASILRGGTPSGTDRGVESSLGNLIADIMSAKVPDADIAIVNPGSLRADLLFTGDGTLTYRDVASVQPFGNSLVAMTLTGAELRELLEAQWYTDGGVPLKRHLSISDEFGYIYDAAAASGSRIGDLRLRGKLLADTDAVRIVTNTFLAGGGDGFNTFTRGINRVDTGYSDLQVTVEYFQSNALVDPPAIGRAVPQGQPGPDPVPEPDPAPDADHDPIPQPEADSGSHAKEGTLANTGAATPASVVGFAGVAALLALAGIAVLRRSSLGSGAAL